MSYNDYMERYENGPYKVDDSYWRLSKNMGMADPLIPSRIPAVVNTQWLRPRSLLLQMVLIDKSNDF